MLLLRLSLNFILFPLRHHTSLTLHHFQICEPCNQIRSVYYSTSSLVEALTQRRKHLQSLLLLKKVNFFPVGFKSTDPSSIFTSIFKSCISLWSRHLGIALHGYLVKFGYAEWADIFSSLVRMYLRFGENEGAYKVFDELPVKDEKLWNFSVCCFTESGFFEEGLSLFEKMLESGYTPSLKSVSSAIMACGELKRIESGLRIHDFVRRNGLNIDVVIGNSLISMYCKMGRLDWASYAFSVMPSKDLVTWNSMINGYMQYRNWEGAFRTFEMMKEQSHLAPNKVTILALVLACGHAGYLDRGRCLHGHLIQTGLLSDFRVGTATVDMYAKCNDIESAQMVFEDGTYEKSLVSWNSLISAYSRNGYYYLAVKLFKKMLNESKLNPDSVSFASIVPVYSSLRVTKSMTALHALIIKRIPEIGDDVVLGTALVDAYGKCNDTDAVESLFACLKEPNVASWNALVGAYSFNHQTDMGLLCLLKMLRSNVSPDAITVLALLQMCAEIGSQKQGCMAHGYTFVKGFSSHLDVENAIIDMYFRCGCIDSAEQVFNLMPVKNAIIWNTVLSGYVRIGSYDSVIRLFSKMQRERVCKPDSITLVLLLQASTTFISCHYVTMVHCYAIKLNLEFETSFMNALIDSYAKSGMIEMASLLFLQMGKLRDRCSWNVIIAGFGMNSKGAIAYELLSKMEKEGFLPDSITFVSLLSACNHAGLIEEGCQYFDLMVNKYKIEPSLEHWTCIIDMFGRAGRLDDVYQLVLAGFSSDFNSRAVWGVLLDACMRNMNLKVGKLVADKLKNLAPENCEYHAMLSNLYAMNKGWDEAAEVRRLCECHGLMKKPGLSLGQV